LKRNKHIHLSNYTTSVIILVCTLALTLTLAAAAAKADVRKKPVEGSAPGAENPCGDLDVRRGEKEAGEDNEMNAVRHLNIHLINN
jgi:hypothetical protein